MPQNRISQHHLGEWLKDLTRFQIIPREDLAEVARDLREKLTTQKKIQEEEESESDE